MKRTENLNLPIYDNPESDIFKINDVNNAHKAIDKQYKELKNIKETVESTNPSANLQGQINDINASLDNIANNRISNNFRKGTSFFCFTDDATTKYLLNQPSRIDNYKKCGITDVLLTLSAKFNGETITPSISYNILKQSAELLRNNGINVGIKVQDSGEELISSSNYTIWFSEKLRILKEICQQINPYTINIANENQITNEPNYRTNWEVLVNELKGNFPNIELTVHTFFSDLYEGKSVVADLVDVFGINYYPYTTDNAVPTSNEVKMAIYKPINGVPFFDTMQEYCKKYNKKFMISEWGTSSFEYQCKNPGTDFLPQSQKKINPQVQAIFMSEACRLFPYIENCVAMYLWSSNCWRNLDTSFERSWAWDESETTINAIAEVWGDK